MIHLYISSLFRWSCKSEEMAQGTYANLAIISHSSSEFILDFIRVVPGAPKAQVKSRVILTPDNAKRLLQETDLKVYQISERVGYGSIDYFYMKFKKYVGISPKEYRKNVNMEE